MCFSIFRLIRAFSDFQNGLDYAFINTADVLDDYYKNLVSFYASQTGTTPAQAEQRALEDFGAYLIGELVRNTGINQLNNREKIRQRFQCHQYMIYALISLGLLIFPFGIDFGMNKGKDKVQKVKIDSVIPVNMAIKYKKDTTERLNIKPTDHGKAEHSKTNATTITPHP